jgi:hypothetical protein
MPTTVADLLAAANLRRSGVVKWGAPVVLNAPGVYVVSLGPSNDDLAAALPNCPVSLSRVERLLQVRPELRLDGNRPTAQELAGRLSALWLGDEAIVYIGLTKRRVQKRVAEYVKTPLGARSPHGGGWPLKTLSLETPLFVHSARTDDFVSAEGKMLNRFMEAVSSEAKERLHDPARPLPFANLQVSADGTTIRKNHGITGALAPK